MTYHEFIIKPRIETWQQFAKYVRSQGCQLLKRLDEVPNSILVAGCQRSGTTMLTRIINSTDGMTDFWVGKDDELDAALILSGRVAHEFKGRYCFQTTYLNECYFEYFQYKNKMKLIWVLRNPFSVVYSLLHNWKNFALNELFRACGEDLLDKKKRKQYDRFGILMVKRLVRACLAYNGKIAQIIEIKKKLPADQVMVIEYDELVRKNETILPAIYEFAGLAYNCQYGKQISNKSLRKSKMLKKTEYQMINTLCQPVYERVLKEKTPL